MTCQCFQIGGPFIAEDPDCPAHGTEAQREERKRDDEITRLRAEVEALRADAERYRWLRATTNTATNSKGERIDVRNMPDRWDAAIDAARKA